eukprot:TRINITY_DN35169_c0_g1_i1.p1 TRINITY_DN35169_c0_g1~~TRINITY_DN35169_c0_g1_i1.p1  ORF type:complete len:700 (+),score=116.82 TRINITY_DN35169_c0_g1_i1:140-2101(+)
MATVVDRLTARCSDSCGSTTNSPPAVGDNGRSARQETNARSAPPTSPSSAATLRIVQVTDVYTLDNFPNLKSLIADKRAELDRSFGPGAKTISMLTGDFLMPYLLSTIDAGRGMMRMLNETPIDYLTWGNHEDDLAHTDVCAREREYEGTWINTNMTSHESFASSRCQRDFAIVEVKSADGTNVRRVGLIAVLSDEPSLYKQGAFGGAKIEDPWATLASYKLKLEEEHGCDLVLPLCHLYEKQDERTMREFDFPVILSGHDHHDVDRVVNGTRLLKPGSDGHQAIMVDITWPAADARGATASDVTRRRAPQIEAQLLVVTDWPPDERLAGLVQSCYAPLDRLRKTQLTVVPQRFLPLSSVGTRESRSTCATFLCSEIRDSLNLQCAGETPHCELVLINGGNFRGERVYRDDEPITLESLKSELGEGVEVVVARIPGRVLEGALCETWKKPGGAWMHYDDGVEVDAKGFVISVSGIPLNKDHIYLVGTTLRFGIRESPSIAAYYAEDKSREPQIETAIPALVLLMSLFAERAWSCIFAAIDANADGTLTQAELSLVDRNLIGGMGRDDCMGAVQKLLGFTTYPCEYSLVDMIMSVAGDVDKDNWLSLLDINTQRRKRVKHLLRLLTEELTTQRAAGELLCPCPPGGGSRQGDPS